MGFDHQHALTVSSLIGILNAAECSEDYCRQQAGEFHQCLVGSCLVGVAESLEVGSDLREAGMVH